MKAAHHVLVVDDDDRLRALIARYLGEQGFIVSTAAHVAEARTQMEWFAVDAVVLDVMMPGQSGLSWLEEWKGREVPVLMLSAMGTAGDRIAGLERGAEEYMAKPFEPKELLLRLNALLKRSHTSAPPVQFGTFFFDVPSGALSKAGEAVYLTTAETQLLKTLATTLGEAQPREALAAALGMNGNERAVDVLVTRLRKKIEESEGKPAFLQTVRGAGYALMGRR